MKHFFRQILFAALLCVPVLHISASENPQETQTILTVGTDKQFQTIQQAVDAARTWNSPCKIIIDSGIYAENITILNDTAPISFVGLEDVVIQSASPYPNSPVYCAGNYSFDNITFATNSDSTYALHIEYIFTKKQEPSILTFTGCKFFSVHTPAVGIGLGKDSTVIFDQCSFITSSEQVASFFGHNLPEENTLNQNLYFTGCIFNHSVCLTDTTDEAVSDLSSTNVWFENCNAMQGLTFSKYKQNEDFTLPCKSGFLLECDDWNIQWK